MKYRLFIRITLLLSAMLWLHLANARVNCRIDRPAFSKTITLQGADITLGADLPVGTILYRGMISNNEEPNGNSAMVCRSNRGDRYTLDYLSRLSGGREVQSGVYATGVPGVGVRIYNWVSGGETTASLSQTADRRLLSYTVPNRQCGITGSVNLCNVPAGTGFLFELIKTGNVAAGQINGNEFPRISVRATAATAGINVQRGEIASVTFSGSLNMKTASCQTPGNYTVELGSYEVNEIERRKSSPWVDASITLTNCPRFSGMPGGNVSTWRYPSSTPSQIGDHQPNLLEVTLTPQSDVRQASEGTFLIEQKAGSATGVDIQLNKGTAENNSPVTLRQPYNLAISDDGAQTLNVPLVARYLRNSDRLAPGSATGKVVYLINYK